ncbi:phage tail protein [Rugamonas rubra]|uniref:Phage tail tube protein, TTP n=1 Tax=Rugamonas rubra TaxID=758825 RepID=A0A1I4SGK1_9BURK|nr:phage tail protein [Rugamonas rubra]SFM63597.1 Phage tail tube protein, TTP [Rugamonas rubra]
MSISLPNGATLKLATVYGSAIPITAASNANPAVLTAAAHGLANGDLVEATSGWSRINNRIFRVSLSAAGTFALEGLDSSNTVTYTPGGGVGSVRKITTLTQITQILETTSSGGEMGFTEVSLLENDFSTQLPTQASAQSIAISIADDPTLAGFIAVKAAAETRTPRALVVTLPNSSVILYNGIVSLDETPSLTKNSIMAVKSTFSLQGRPVRY